LLKKVLFLCSGNSCRSQIAEAIVNARLGDRWKAFSAGTDPVGYVHPITIQVLSEIDIHHEGASKSVEHFKNMAFDLVITVCDDAAENCPLWLGKGKRVHISFPDPAKVKGSEQGKLAAFRNVRDAIADKVIHFLSQDA
jgi:arsenate reductase